MRAFCTKLELSENRKKRLNSPLPWSLLENTMLLKMMAIFFDIGIGLFAWAYIRFLLGHTSNYKLAISFGLISVTSGLFLTLFAFVLPGADIIVAMIFLSYCTITAAFNLQLKAKGISPVITLPAWTTPILTMFLLGVLLTGILTTILVNYFS